MHSGPFFHFKLSKIAHRKQPKSLKARFLLKTIEIADYRWKPDYAFNPECLKSLRELDMMSKDT